jgi:hypothetical protein
MKNITLEFGTPEDTTPPGLIGAEIRFPFTAIATELIDSPEEKQHTTRHRIRAKATATWIPTVWKMEENAALVKVIFEIAKLQLVASLQRGEQLKDEFVVNITTMTHRTLPFDPDRLQRPDGQTVPVEVHEQIGFIPSPTR